VFFHEEDADDNGDYNVGDGDGDGESCHSWW